MAIREHENAFTLQIEVRLRLAVAEDLPKLEWMGQYIHFRRLYQHTYEDQLAGRRLMIVADFNGFPIGQVFLHLGNADFADSPLARGYLYALRVMEPFQRQGIGTRLIDAAETMLRQRGYRWAAIAVAKDNPNARRLYERLGYVVFADDPGRWQYADHEGRIQRVVEPAWMLQKRLSAWPGPDHSTA